jgi:hypothetical protein
MTRYRYACVVAGLLLFASGLVKIVDPEPERLLGAWSVAAAWVELALGVAFLRPSWNRLAARGLLGMATVYTAVVVYLGLSRLPLSGCGCFGSTLRLGLGAHLLALGTLGLLACACIWLEPNEERRAGHLHGPSE